MACVPRQLLADEAHAASLAASTEEGGRADVYIGFFEVGLNSLCPGGALGFICADRWMRNQYGQRLRSMVTTGFSVETVIEMHDVDAFDEDVSAYPSVTILRCESQGPAIVATANKSFDEAGARRVRIWEPAPDSSFLTFAKAIRARAAGLLSAE